MRTFSFVFTLSLASIVAGCSGSAEPASAPPPPTSTGAVAVPTADPEPVATTDPTAEPTADPGPAVPPPPKSSGYRDLTDSPGDARLAEGIESLKAGEANRARQAFSKVLPDIDVSGSLDVKMAAHVLLARACQSAGDAKCAAAHHKTVRELWKDPAAGAKSIEALGGDDTTKLQRLGRALSAVGESLFYAAEEKRLEVEKEKAPEYKGSGKKDDVLKHINTKVAAWIKARRAKIDEAEKAYTAIVALQPVPPPRWVVDASSRVGQMWGAFAREFRATPVPKEWKQNGPIPGLNGYTWDELREAYYAAIDEAAAPILLRARAAFTSCQGMSKRYAYSDDLSRACDDWLVKNAPSASP